MCHCWSNPMTAKWKYWSHRVARQLPVVWRELPVAWRELRRRKNALCYI